MPNTIPKWDQLRVLMNYLTERQMRPQPTNLRQLSARLGVGSQRIFEILDEENIKYRLIYWSEDRTLQNTEIFLTVLPTEVRRIYKVPEDKWQDSLNFFRVRARAVKKLDKVDPRIEQQQQREADRIKKLRYFLADNPLETP